LYVVLFTENQKNFNGPPLSDGDALPFSKERERDLFFFFGEGGLAARREGRSRKGYGKIARGGITSFLFQTPLQRSCPGELPTGRSDETTGEREWTKGASASFFLSFFSSHPGDPG